MTKAKLYLILQAAVCVALAVMLSASAIGIYREGAARRAISPQDAIYTPQIIAEKAVGLAPLCLVSACLLALGLILGIRDKRADRPVPDAQLLRDLAVARVAAPSGEMRRERRLQRWLRIAGWAAFAACMVPVGLYMADPGHFPQDDLESMLAGLLRALVPWTAAGLGALALAFVLAERSVKREIKAAKAQMKLERRQSSAPGDVPTERASRTGAIQAALIVAALALIVAGAINGSARDVLYKAISICTECVGLG